MTDTNLILRSVTVEGYKGFEKPATIYLSPLTLVFGENSAGKSSIMRLLVSIAKAILEQSEYPLIPVSVDNEDYGFDSLLTNGASSLLKISLSLDDLLSETPTLQVSYSIRYLRESNRALITDIDFQRNTGEKWSLHLITDSISKQPYLRDAPYRYSSKNEDIGSALETVIRFEGLLPVTRSLNKSNFLHINNGLNEIAKTLKAFAESVIWIGPLRRVPPRHIPLTCHPTRFSPDGREVPQLLHASNQFGEQITTKTSEFYEDSTGRQLTIQPSVLNGKEVFTVLLAPIEHPTLVIPIADHGAGMAQVLPVATLCAWAACQPGLIKSPILLFENPELHLHDAVHEPLANLFLDTISKRPGTRIVAETHSENLLLTVQLQVIKSKNNSLSKDVGVNWILKDTDGRSKIDLFQFDEAGSLGGLWSKSIFGYTSDLAKRILSARLKTTSVKEE